MRCACGWIRRSSPPTTSRRSTCAQALARENIELPSGRIEGDDIELPVKTLSRLNTPAEFNALIVKRDGDSVVRFRDIGYAELGAQNERGALKMGDMPIAGLYFKQQPGANQIEIVDELRARLDQIRKEIPDDIKVDVAYDNTRVRAPLAARGDRDHLHRLRAGRAGGVRLPARVAHDADSGDRDSGVRSSARSRSCTPRGSRSTR